MLIDEVLDQVKIAIKLKNLY